MRNSSNAFFPFGEKNFPETFLSNFQHYIRLARKKPSVSTEKTDRQCSYIFLQNFSIKLHSYVLNNNKNSLIIQTIQCGSN